MQSRRLRLWRKETDEAKNLVSKQPELETKHWNVFTFVCIQTCAV